MYAIYVGQYTGNASFTEMQFVEQSLAVSSGETFAIHTMAHIHLERGMLDAGLAFLQSKAKYWEVRSN